MDARFAMRVRVMAMCMVMGLSAAAVQAQMPMGAGPAPAAGTVVAPAKAIDAQLNIIEGELMGAAKAMPAEKYDFAPSQAIFVPGQKTEFATVRTFGQQVAHVAQANYYFYSAVSGQAMDASAAAVAKMTKKDDLVAALAASFAAAHKAIATVTAANAFEVVKVEEMGLFTRATLAQFAISHANDHYGQLVEYLRMNGIVPPASAK
jgi:uncharacterized damage-inducible protein DinB